ncbi:hypothetical protein FRX31_033227 [Thalictrum thalictroides]|uniref:Transmembrane protein n=1 Tax=Thalictrum thalictroides TaxID=46969 RepID=A0A7J6UYD2_THATH|nr:hypothetical protein FRX31_033227 [Thalictrum thalictroides]
MVELICFVACSLSICALSNSACACCLILFAFANSCSANSICLLDCCLASSANVFSAIASFSCSCACSFILVAMYIDSSVVFLAFGELFSAALLDLFLFTSFLSPWSHDPIESCN